MATVDVVVVAGGAPANFCDLGGGGSAAGVVAALEVIARDPQVRSILFNIFGGITRCDEVARGILDRARRARASPSRSSSASTGRTPRRAGASSPRRRRREPRRRADDARRRPARGGARGMSDPWSERAELYRTSAVHVHGPDLDLIVEWADGCATRARRRDRRGPRRPAAARGRARGRELRPGAGDGAGRRLRRRGAALRRRELRRRRLHGAPRTTSPIVAAGARRDGARQPRARPAPGRRLRRASEVEEAERLRDPSHVAQLQRAARGASSSPQPGSSVEEVAHFDEPLDFESWLARTGCAGETAAAGARAARRPHRRRPGRYPYASSFKARKRR